MPNVDPFVPQCHNPLGYVVDAKYLPPPPPLVLASAINSEDTVLRFEPPGLPMYPGVEEGTVLVLDFGMMSEEHVAVRRVVDNITVEVTRGRA